MILDEADYAITIRSDFFVRQRVVGCPERQLDRNALSPFVQLGSGEFVEDAHRFEPIAGALSYRIHEIAGSHGHTKIEGKVEHDGWIGARFLEHPPGTRRHQRFQSELSGSHPAFETEGPHHCGVQFPHRTNGYSTYQHAGGAAGVIPGR